MLGRPIILVMDTEEVEVIAVTAVRTPTREDDVRMFRCFGCEWEKSICWIRYDDTNILMTFYFLEDNLGWRITMWEGFGMDRVQLISLRLNRSDWI